MKKTIITLIVLLAFAGLLQAATTAKPGDIFTLGSYPYTEDGEIRPVEWIVAGTVTDYVTDEQSLLCISRDILDVMTITGNTDYLGTVWQNLNIRDWLNDSFLNRCFTSSEQRLLLGNPNFEANPDGTSMADEARSTGDDDKVNILGDPWLDYIASNELRKAKPTPYAAKKELVTDKDGCSAWIMWMSLIENAGRTNIVDAEGNAILDKINRYSCLGIRPTIRISKYALVEVTGKVAVPEFKVSNTAKAYSPGAALKRGDVITFGEAEQDANAKNGKEAIEWIVLEAQPEKALVISRKVLYSWDCYENDYAVFLNDKFYKNAFSDSEKNSILTTENTTVESIDYYTYPDPEGYGEGWIASKIKSVKTAITKDKVFILSQNELGKYFPTNESRKAAPTKEAKRQGKEIDALYGEEFDEYRTRECVYFIDGSWSYSHHGGIANTGIRPAMWIKTGGSAPAAEPEKTGKTIKTRQ